MISAKDVNELRSKTGAGMMDCKKALTECNGDMEAAIDWLREKGIAKAAKKADRIAAEGLANIFTDGNKAVILEVNCETDFVTKNAEFVEMIENVGKAILKGDTNDMDKINELDVDGQTVAEYIVAKTAKIGEKLSLRRAELVSKADTENFGTYLHMGGKIAVLVVVEGANEDVAKDVAMQTAAMNPTALKREQVPQEVVDREAKVIKEQVMGEGKPEEIAEKMVTGRLNKFYKEICLEEQAFIKDSGVTVKDYVKNNGGEIVSMIRFAVGEGIEKKQEDFASEVMSQIQNS